MLITVAICTYQRPDRVDFALSSLECQNYAGSDWEVLLVENDVVGTPAMQAVCQLHQSKLPLRHIIESNIGLSHARNTAVREASGEYIAYLDDDAEADSSWIATLAQACRESQPDFCGGPSYPLYRSQRPSWFLDRYFTCYIYGDQSRWLGKGEWLGGMNFVVNRKLCKLLGGFRVDLGMTGKMVAYGEDTDIQMRAWISNPQQLRVRYLPKASVHHEVRPEKMTLHWNVRAAWAGGRSSSIMTPLKRKQAINGLIDNTKELVKQIVYVVLYWNRNQARRILWRQWVYEVFCPWLWNFSRNLHALFRWQ